MSGARVIEAREEPLAEGLPPILASKFRNMSHEEAAAILSPAEAK
jgi:hypothetical protein